MITLTPTTSWDIKLPLIGLSKITLTEKEGARSALTFHYSDGATIELAVTRQDDNA